MNKRPIIYPVPFLVAAVVILAAASGAVGIYGAVPLSLMINRYNHPLADSFFSQLTYLGDGWAAVFIVLVLLFRSYRSAASMAAANIGAGIATQFLKRVVFSDALRPAKFFEGWASVHTVPGVTIYAFNSFPSGHAATSFAIWYILATLSPSRLWQLFCFFCAAFIAFSRIYLLQHFVNDVTAGAVIGIGFAIAALKLFEQRTDTGRKTFDGALFRTTIGTTPPS